MWIRRWVSEGMVLLCPVVGKGDGIANSFARGHIAVFGAFTNMFEIERIRKGAIEERTYDDG